MSLNFTDIVTMLMKNEDLQSVLDAMAEHLLATVIVTNDVMDIIACSKTVAPRDPYWVQALSDGYCSSEMLAAIYKTPPANVPRVSEIYSGLDYAPDNATLKYFVSLPKDTFHYSFSVFALPLENRVEKRQQDLLLSFAGLLKSTHFRTEKLPLANVYQGKKGYLQTLLNPESEYLLQTEIPASVANSSADFDHIQVLVFSPELQETVDMLLFAHTEAICSLTGNDYATVYNGSVVALFHTKKWTNTLKNNLYNLLKKQMLKSVLVGRFLAKSM